MAEVWLEGGCLCGASLKNPETYEPELHCHTGEHLDWVKIADNLPRYRGTAEQSQS